MLASLHQCLFLFIKLHIIQSIILRKPIISLRSEYLLLYLYAVN